ncbi:bifunctional glutamate N-acetyltransferase/amino-acid acetyltransferase ArgJ [Kiloniella sp. b19]|uniref:bifunctional glutamate N-acetyltransferase/amino-acid acetyltransferase ArgJ n=1 Tax=Kiloniella sp. GXU_MW_B19 TaxID=3141326 RepID=UPI0031D6C401
MPSVKGVSMATAMAGIKYQGRTDLLLMTFEPGATIGGVLTKSLTASAPVELCREHLKKGQVRAIVVNSGNSNAFTGVAGRRVTEEVLEATARQLGCDVSEVYMASTGVIGELLPIKGILDNLAGLQDQQTGNLWEEAAKAIMTTDTFHKGASRTAVINGATVTINGISKGSGMIAPDMATMLAFVATDAKLPASVVQELIREGADQSFNAITVDSDTSTSDTLLMAASGAVNNGDIASASSPELADFRAALFDLLRDLSHQVVKDGEGASKFVEIEVTGAESEEAARAIGLSIANSPLVKTAIAGEDANWGRVVMAVGKSGQRADRDKLTIAMGGVTIASNGGAVEGYDEAPVTEHMRGQNISISVDVGVGSGSGKVWTCDLTHGYITINGDYRS